MDSRGKGLYAPPMVNNGSLTSSHIPVLEPLRGLAAFSVCLFHFGLGNGQFLAPDDPVAAIASFGWLGVDAFFVMSGFLIPYSLELRSYSLKDLGSFFARRLKRLEPPYFTSILIVILLHWLSMHAPAFRGAPLDLSWQRLAAHVAYLNAILEFGWLNPVFWTLAIEFQYYIFVAIAFPLLCHKNACVRHSSSVMIAVLGFAGFGNSALLLHWLPLFSIGMVSYQFYVGRISLVQLLTSLPFIIYISDTVIGLQQTVVGVLTATVIVLARHRELPRFMNPCVFLGRISYSLYLLHVPIGVRIINLVDRLPNSVTYRYLGIAAAFAVSIASAWVFWRLIELPSQSWAKGGGQRTGGSPKHSPSVPIGTSDV